MNANSNPAREPKTDLPGLTEDYILTEEQIRSFREDGHLRLNHVASAEEAAAYREEIAAMVRRLNCESRPLQERDAYGKAFLQIMDIWSQSEAVRRFVLARRFAKIAAELMGVEGVRVYHDQALFKEPGGGPTPWHQDQIYWPLDTTDMITMWMPLTSIAQEAGSLDFATGSHKLGYISKLEISEESHKTLKQYIEASDMEVVNYGAMAAGDATFHYGWTLHSAPGNSSDAMREVMTVIYYPDGTQVLEPDTNARRRDLERWLPGLRPGDAAASPKNPLVYHRTVLPDGIAQR